MFLIVQVPIFNEERTLPSLIEQTHAILEGWSTPQRRFLILLLNDGSRDGSWSQIQELSARYERVMGVHHPRQLGLGRVFRRGVTIARHLGADILVNMDGDAQFDPHDIPTLIRPIVERKAEVVLTTRFACPQRRPAMPASKRWGNKAFALLLSQLTGRTFTDVSCGFRAFSGQALRALRPDLRFTYTHESILQSHAAGLRIKEVPLAVRGEREFGRSRVARSLFRYGLFALSGVAATQCRLLWRHRTPRQVERHEP